MAVLQERGAPAALETSFPSGKAWERKVHSGRVVNAIDLLRIQQQEANRLLARIDNAIGSDKRLWIDELAAHLRAHFTAEERVIYPVAFGPRTHDLLADAIEDNNCLRRRVTELATCSPTSRHFPLKLRLLKEEFERHLIEEEDLLFVMRGRLNEAQLEKLGRELAAAYQQVVHTEPAMPVYSDRAPMLME